MKVEKKYFTIKEAADILGIHVETLYRYVKNGNFPYVKVLNRKMIRLKDLDMERYVYKGNDKLAFGY